MSKQPAFKIDCPRCGKIRPAMPAGKCKVTGEALQKCSVCKTQFPINVFGMR